MKSFYFYIFLYLSLSTTGCAQVDEIDNIKTAPTVVKADEAFANVYQPLDGTWQGVFSIYEDPKPPQLDKNQLIKLTKDQATDKRFNKSYEINVTQVYTSESPYFQRVKITDYNPKTKETEISHGVNKIQNGEMWCVVHKPSGTVIHEGSTDGPSTIIWQSQQDKPLKVEYFYESISNDTYEIIGYGYYDKDDTKLMPRLWFYGSYDKVK